MQFTLLFAFLTTVVGPLVKKVLVALGIGTVSYIGMNALLDRAKSEIMSNFNGMLTDVVQLMGLAKVDVAINIVFSAILVRLVMNGFNKVTGSKKSLGSVGS